MARELISSATVGTAGLDQTLLALEPELRELLTRFHIPELDAADLISSSVVESVFKSQDPHELALRARATLELRCRHYWLTRRFDAPRSVSGLQATPSAVPDGSTPSTRPTLRRLLQRLGRERSAT